MVRKADPTDIALRADWAKGVLDASDAALLYLADGFITALNLAHVQHAPDDVQAELRRLAARAYTKFGA